MDEKYPRINFRVSPEENEYWRVRAEAEGKPLSQLVKEALDAYRV